MQINSNFYQYSNCNNNNQKRYYNQNNINFSGKKKKQLTLSMQALALAALLSVSAGVGSSAKDYHDDPFLVQAINAFSVAVDEFGDFYDSQMAESRREWEAYQSSSRTMLYTNSEKKS